jgi:hypothetical protein
METGKSDLRILYSGHEDILHFPKYNRIRTSHCVNALWT